MLHSISLHLVILSVLVTLTCVSCSGVGQNKSEDFPAEFFGARMGDDSAAVVRALRKNKIVRLDSISSGAGWMHFMKRPQGFMLVDDELWEMASVHLSGGKMHVIRFSNAYPTQRQAEEEYRGMARRLSQRYPLRMQDEGKEAFVIMKCIAVFEDGGLNFALTNGKSLSGRPTYDVVLEFYRIPDNISI